jgi:phosphoglycerol transferase
VTRADLIGVALAAIGSLLAATFSLQLWHAHLRIPFFYGSDGTISLATVKWAVSGGGWLYTNHQVGAPFGLELFDYPLTTDNLNFVAMWLIGRVTSDPARVMNTFFLLTFPAEAVAGFAVLRRMNVSVATSVVAAILFADSPYHLFRNETHLLLSQYISVPLATYLIISILDGRRIVTGSLRPLSWPSLVSRRNLFVLLLCVVIGSCGVYYAVFAIIILGAAGLASGVRLRAWTPAAQAAVIIIAIGAVVFINDLPTAVYRHEHGTNPVAAKRQAKESEMYALKLAEMVLPVPGHRIHALAAIRNRYDTTNPVPSEDGQQSLGIVGVIGLAWMFLIGIGAIVGAGRAGPSVARQRQLAFAAMVAFIVGTLGGISALIGYLITPQIRGWDRISIFIDFFALATVAIGLDTIARRWLRGRRLWTLLGLAVVLVIGIFDQSSRIAVPTYTVNRLSWGSDGQFVSAIERVLAPGSSVFELPYMAFPEVPPINNMQDYDPLRGYIHSTDLIWSYPVMEARPADWDSQTVSLPPGTEIDGVIAAGFQGLWIDRQGYTDAGVQIIGAVQGLLGEAPMNSPDGRFAFFDLRAYGQRLRARYPAAEIASLRTAILHPPIMNWGNGFYAPEADGSRWALDDAVATAENQTSRPRRVSFFADIQTLSKGRFDLRVVAPGGVVKHFVIGDRPRPISFTFTLAPGPHVLQFSSTAPAGYAPPDPRQLAVRYGTAVISGIGMAPFLPAGQSAPGG